MMNVIRNFKFLLDREKVLKSISLNSDSYAYEEVCDIYKLLEKDLENTAEPKAVFKFYEMKDKYRIDEAEDCTHVVLCILTLGKGVEESIQQYFKEDKYIEGMLLDTMADILLSGYTDQLYKNICKEAEERKMGLTCRLSPGNADFPVEMQLDILEELNGYQLLNVNATSGFMLTPVKTVSFIFGADQKLDIPDSDHECRRCPNISCRMRKEPYTGKKNETYYNLTVISEQDKISIKASKSKSIMEALRQNGIQVASPCGGNGTCGKCKIRILEGKVNKLSDNSILGKELLDKGWCLSCSTFLQDDCVISLDGGEPDYNILQAFDESNINIDSYYSILDLNLKNKDLGGQSFTSVINSEFDSEYNYTLSALRKLQTFIDSDVYNKKHISLITKKDTVLDVCIGDAGVYGIAIDIGTTTIALCLVNLITGSIVNNYSLLNSQKQFGSDVITRIQCSNDGKLNLLNESIKRDLKKGIMHICSASGIEPDQIYSTAIAGNTTMLYLLLGISCKSLALVPFNNVTTSLLKYKYYELFGDNYLNCPVTILPGVSAYVGADIVSGILKCGYNNLNKTCILIDIGTNGEMVIGNKDRTLCLATAAGPAFEGANITCGIGGVAGAISQIDIRDGKVAYRTIGNEAARGICGSAVIDITAACLRNNIIDETGRFDEDNYSEGFIKISENIKNEDIIFNQKDVREVQLAKSAIRSGIEILLGEFKASYENIDTVFLAGGFGYYMNIENAAYIGLIPEELMDKVKCVGNSSLGGTVKYLLCKDTEAELRSILKNISYIDIASNNRFNDLFIDNMLF